MTLKLSELEAPLDDVEFPNGTRHQPVPFGPTEYRLWREARNEPDADKRDAAMLQILEACYPTATSDDFESCTIRMMAAMIAHAMRRIDTAQTALKNVVAVAAAPETPPPPPPSSPKTSGAISSPKSRKRSGKTGGASTTASPTDDPNTSGTPTIAWTSPNGSTVSGGNSTTSTVPF